jgi:hypothetical protein
VAEKIEVEVVGKSKYEVAHTMAYNIITLIDKKKIGEVSRAEYLKAVRDSIMALEGIGG